MDDESQPSEEILARELADSGPLLASDWLWRPWYAKLWWAALPIYWSGRMASLKLPVLLGFYDTLLAAYLAIFCNPMIVFLILGFGYVRTKLNRGKWVITRGAINSGRRPGELLDPYTDFTDPRSGIRYLRHRGVLKDQHH